MDRKLAKEILNKEKVSKEAEQLVDNLIFENYVLEQLCTRFASQLGVPDVEQAIAEARKKVMEDVVYFALEKG